MIKKIFITICIIFLVIILIFLILQFSNKPNKIQYGVSFNTLYARELGLEPREVYLAILDDLGVKHLRLAAHWDLIEPEDDKWNFEELDFQVNEARKRNAEIILGVGRRLPRWPECHIPHWAKENDWKLQKEELREYIKVVVDRYKDYENIIYRQVENEPFLTVFATDHCGDLDVEFLDEEIALVKKLDPNREILITDSGNLGLWASAYKRGDLFGTSVYVFLWNPDVGPFKSFLPPSWYRAKANLMKLLFGKKETLLIELSLEPWLLQPVVETSKELQLERMDINKFNEIINFAEETNFEKQYLWGAVWWYFMKKNDYPIFWERAKEIFTRN